MGKNRTVTYQDIAEYTGFSKTTISRYFNDRDSLTIEKQDRISEALTKLDYRQNKVAKVLANGKTEIVGILLPDLYHHFYYQILNYILGTYRQFGFKFLVFNGDHDVDVERKYIQELMAYKVEGMIVLSNTLSSEELAGIGIPIVGIEREDRHIHSVNTDNYLGGQMAAELLSSRGCTKLFHINSEVPPWFTIPARDRIPGFVDYCEKNGIPHEEYYFRYRREQKSLQEQICHVVEQIDNCGTEGKTGIFAANDTYANAALNCLLRRGKGIPSDYQIVGFDNSPIAVDSVFPISTIGQQAQLMAESAVSLLSGEMRKMRMRRPEPSAEPIHKVIPPVMVERETTKPASGTGPGPLPYPAKISS